MNPESQTVSFVRKSWTSKFDHVTSHICHFSWKMKLARRWPRITLTSTSEGRKLYESLSLVLTPGAEPSRCTRFAASAGRKFIFEGAPGLISISFGGFFVVLKEFWKSVDFETYRSLKSSSWTSFYIYDTPRLILGGFSMDFSIFIHPHYVTILRDP